MTTVRRALIPAILFAIAGPTIAAQTPVVAGVAELFGRVKLVLPENAKAGPTGIVVWLPGLRIDAPPAPALIASKDKRFEPRILAVSAGSSVRFPNMDSIYHNAFSLSPGNTFDMGLYRKGASRDIALKSPGIVRIYCNIHPEMAASVVVVDGNAFTVARADGSFRISGLPPGRHEVHVWSDLAGEQVSTLNFEAGRATEWSPSLDATKYQRSAHLNKFGKTYPKAKNGADRY
ncbi:MAG: carboxypeptidase regulatory-like domain-containing protein [Vicinamibacteria bacterium]